PSAQEARQAVDELAVRVERQNLLLQTLLRLLLEKGVIHEDEFKKWISYVDALDGKTDGKLQKEKGIKNCPACGRVSQADAAKCQYCGADYPVEFIDYKARQ
ncbi:hypothetical protein HY256_06735, partial [Candidatus Sumerlaeota bacterium]|nr:hypothetical protein [Candidatus Sumerlaeota bacterium]